MRALALQNFAALIIEALALRYRYIKITKSCKSIFVFKTPDIKI